MRQGGVDLYHVYDDNGWHYNYPPLFAILLAPLADPPTQDLSVVAGNVIGLAGGPLPSGPLLAAVSLSGSRAPLRPDIPPVVPYVPWNISVAIFYLLNLALLAWSLHHLARALEDAGGTRFGWRQGWGNRRWFMLRMLPLSVCLIPIAHTLMRSQANLFLLALFCGMMAALVRGQRFRAGLCVAGAICLKIFPAYLLIVPLLRRDLRCLTGCAVGLFLGLVAIPVAALGPRQAAACYADLAEVLVGPALGLGNDQSRALELIDVPASDSQSFQALIHNTMYLDPYKRPRKVIPLARELHWLIGGSLTLLTLLAGWKHRHSRGPVQPIFVGALLLIMLLLSPVCHTHYFALAVPLLMGLLALSWDRQAARGSAMARTCVSGGLLVLIAVLNIGFVPPLLPGMQVLRDACWMTYGILVLWGTACLTLWRLPVTDLAAGHGRTGLAVAA